MKKRIINLAVLLFLFSCEEYNPQFEHTLIPLNDGNTWIYEENVYNETGIVNTDTSTVTIDGITGLSVEGEEVCAYEIRAFDGNNITTTYLGKEQDGIYDYGFVADENFLFDNGYKVEYLCEEIPTYRGLYAKFPVIQKERWIYRYKELKNNQVDDKIIITEVLISVMVECITVDEEINCEAGSFHCIGYKYGDDENYTLEYFKFKLGLVKSESYENGKLVHDKTLIAYDLK